MSLYKIYISSHVIWITCTISILYGLLRLIQYIIVVSFTKKTFNRLNSKFTEENDPKIYNKLKIYKQSIPIYNFSHKKKKRVLLLIGGYRDIPFMWNNYCNYLKERGIDYYAPRTTGHGRRFFQKSIKWQDWMLTYFESIIFLSQIYKRIDIIGFSTGANIAVYLMGIDWNNIDNYSVDTEIKNLILISPNFEVNKKHAGYKKLLKSKFAYNFLNFICPVGDKPSYKKNVEIDLRYTKDLDNIYYERSIFLESLYELWRFSDILPDKINIDNITIYHGDSDNVVGDFSIQRKKLGLIFQKKIKSYKLTNCGHNLINEHPKSRKILFNSIHNVLNL